MEQIAGKIMEITAAKSLLWSRLQTRSIIETNAALDQNGHQRHEAIRVMQGISDKDILSSVTSWSN